MVRGRRSRGAQIAPQDRLTCVIIVARGTATSQLSPGVTANARVLVDRLKITGHHAAVRVPRSTVLHMPLIEYMARFTIPQTRLSQMRLMGKAGQSPHLQPAWCGPNRGRRTRCPLDMMASATSAKLMQSHLLQQRLLATHVFCLRLVPRPQETIAMSGAPVTQGEYLVVAKPTTSRDPISRADVYCPLRRRTWNNS